MIDKEKIIEIEKCAASAEYFIFNYCRTLHKERGIMLLPEWDYLLMMAYLFGQTDRLFLLKSRQMTLTWLALAYNLWVALFKKSGDIIFLSKRQDESFELISRLKIIYGQLPDWMKPTVGEDNKKILSFPKINSRFISLPNSPHAVRMYSPHSIVWDEMAFTPNDEEIWAAITPLIKDGTKFIGITTSAGPLNQFASSYNDCTEITDENYKEINFSDKGINFRYFLHYSKHPEKDLEWINNAKVGVSESIWGREMEGDLSIGGKRVYPNFCEDNLIEKFDYKGKRLFRSMDFGFHTPVVQWFCVTDNMKVVMFHEWIGEDKTIEQMAMAIKENDEILGLKESDFEMNYGDPAGESVTDEGISAVQKLRLQIRGFKFTSRKSNIEPGVDLVQSKIRDANDIVNFYLVKKCVRTISDMKAYGKGKNSNLPIKDNKTDHTNDSVRYFFIGLFGLKNSSPLGLIGAKVVGVKL